MYLHRRDYNTCFRAFSLHDDDDDDDDDEIRLNLYTAVPHGFARNKDFYGIGRFFN